MENKECTGNNLEIRQSILKLPTATGNGLHSFKPAI